MYFVLNCLSRLIGRMGPGAANSLARFLAFLLWDVFRFRRHLVLKNLSVAFGDQYTAKEFIKIGHDSVLNFILTFIEFFRSQDVDISSNVKIEGRDHVVQALAANKGVYVLCFHMGNWEAMGAAVTKQIVPSRIVVKRVGSASVDRFVTELREKNGFYPIVRRSKGDGFKGIVEHLDKNEIVGFVMDQSRPGSPKLDFFGEPAKTNTSFAAILKKRKAPVIPGYIIREKIGHHTVHFLPEVQIAETNDMDQDIITNSLLFNKIIENIVRQFPSQYFWLHDRWKK